MRKRLRARRGASPSAIVLAAIAASTRAREQEFRLLTFEVESLSPRVRARLEDERATSDVERRRLLDQLARLEKALAALATNRGDRLGPASNP